jgi:thymidylate kinase
MGLVKVRSSKGYSVKMRHLKPQILISQRSEPVAIVVNPHGKPPRSVLTSLVKIVVWLIEEWYANLFQDQEETLLICDRYYHDLLIDPIRYRYGGPQSVAKLVSKLMPQPDLWVLLDAPAEVLQARKQEVSLEETARQRNAYKKFVQHQKAYVVVDASQSLNRVITGVQHAITELCRSIMPAEDR